ncbi:MAG: hypothetical protein AAFP77_10675 [Bacteroidota bacterium]
MPHFPRLRTLPILAILCSLLLYTCNSDDDIPAPVIDECEPDSGDVLITTWNNIAFLGGQELCMDTLCMFFELDIREDSTYSWDYLIFDERSAPLYIAEHHDTGTYTFDCQQGGVTSIQNLLFEYVEGNLLLHSDSGLQDTFEIDYDGFYGMQVLISTLDPALPDALMLVNE